MSFFIIKFKPPTTIRGVRILDDGEIPHLQCAPVADFSNAVCHHTCRITKKSKKRNGGKRMVWTLYREGVRIRPVDRLHAPSTIMIAAAVIWHQLLVLALVHINYCKCTPSSTRFDHIFFFWHGYRTVHRLTVL